MSVRRIFLVFLASIFGLLKAASSEILEVGELSLVQSENEIVVSSSAGIGWRAVVAVSPTASVESPGGGVIRAVHVPADNPESLVGAVPKHFATGPFGIDNLEWRYVPKGSKWGIRESIGTGAVIDELRVEAIESSKEIAIVLAGSWENVPRFSKRIVFGPKGWRVRVSALWDGPDEHYGMWWMWSLFKGDKMDAEAVMVWDASHEPVSLPMRKGQVYRLPEGIEIPYEVAFPLVGAPASGLNLKIKEFGGETPRGACYELWPEEVARQASDPSDTYKVFMPRWVSSGIEKREYIFEYEWTVAE